MKRLYKKLISILLISVLITGTTIVYAKENLKENTLPPTGSVDPLVKTGYLDPGTFSQKYRPIKMPFSAIYGDVSHLNGQQTRLTYGQDWQTILSYTFNIPVPL